MSQDHIQSPSSGDRSRPETGITKPETALDIQGQNTQAILERTGATDELIRGILKHLPNRDQDPTATVSGQMQNVLQQLHDLGITDQLKTRELADILKTAMHDGDEEVLSMEKTVELLESMVDKLEPDFVEARRNFEDLAEQQDGFFLPVAQAYAEHSSAEQEAHRAGWLAEFFLRRKAKKLLATLQQLEATYGTTGAEMARKREQAWEPVANCIDVQRNAEQWSTTLLDKSIQKDKKGLMKRLSIILDRLRTIDPVMRMRNRK